jgi:hypothetical protein
VRITFDFASADWGDVNHWSIIAGGTPVAVADASALTYQGTTANGDASDLGYKWATKTYDVVVTTGASGRIYVQVGVWGTWEALRTYYVDNLRVGLTAQ